MNSAAKLIKQADFFNGEIRAIEWNASIRYLAALLTLVIISALAVVYVANGTRLAYSELQKLEQHSQAMKMHEGQLLLEKASLSSAQRIAAVAKYHLKMHNPATRYKLVLSMA